MTQAKVFILFEDNDMIMEVASLRNSTALAGVFLNAATVQLLSLLDEAGVAVDIAPDVLPQTLTYVAASDGVYRLTFKDSWDFKLGDVHKVVIRDDAGAGLRAEWTLAVEDKLREE